MGDKEDRMCPIGLTRSCGYWMKQQEQITKLQAQNDKYELAFKVLSPYNGVTNKEGRQEAIEHSIKFIETRLPKHHTEASDDCVYCSVISLARWVSEILQAIKKAGG